MTTQNYKKTKKRKRQTHEIGRKIKEKERERKKGRREIEKKKK